MKIPRSARLGSEYQKEIAEIIAGPLKDHCPNLSGLISVTQADVSGDLKNATVYISIYAKSQEIKLKSFETIKDNASFIRHELSQIMRMRTVPELKFVLDNTMEYGAHMDSLFEKIHQKDSSSSSDSSEDK